MEAFYLSQPRYPGLYEIPVIMPGYHFREGMAVSGHIGPWSHYAHRTGQDIKELRQFIQVRFPKQFPNSRDPAIVLRCGTFIGLLVNDHGA